MPRRHCNDAASQSRRTGAANLEQPMQTRGAAALMATENLHHIAIVDGEGRPVGIASAIDVARWLARNDGFGEP
ncbi:MAG: CBS domain-containing protein [Kofleriaceae bacterium]